MNCSPLVPLSMENFPGKNTGMDCHFFLLKIILKWERGWILKSWKGKRWWWAKKWTCLWPKLIQFSCLVMSDSLRPHCSTPGLPVHHQLLEYIQTLVHWVDDAIQPSHPRSSPSPPAPSPSQHQDYEIMKLSRQYKKMNEKWWQTLSKMLIHFCHFRDQIVILPGGLKLRWNEVDSRHR